MALLRGSPMLLVATLSVVLLASSSAFAQDMRRPGLSSPASPEDIRGPGLSGPANPEPERPSALVPLYLSLGTLNALDVHSTRRARTHGAAEANPLMRGIAGNTGALLAVKAAATTGMIYASEKMWKKNRVGAVVFMIAANSAMAWIVQHNYRAVR